MRLWEAAVRLWGRCPLAREDGQATVLFALMATALLGSAALVVDVGRAYVLKARAENAMAAAALAGAADLPFDPGQALAQAQAVGAANGFPAARYAVACGGVCIEATVASGQGSFFAQVLGYPGTSVAAAAAAARAATAVTSYQTPAVGAATAQNGYVFFSSVPPGFSSAGPWPGGSQGSEAAGDGSQAEGSGEAEGDGTSGEADASGASDGGGGWSTFAYNPNDVGQAGLLPFDVTVATVTQTPLYTPITLKVGAGEASDGNFGAVRIDGPGADTYRNDIVYGAQDPVQVGEVLTTQPGDMVGPTDQAMEQRFANYANGDPQLAVVPVVDTPQGGCVQGAGQVTVAGFAAVLLQHYTPSSGNEQGEVQAEFVGALLPSASDGAPPVATGVFGGRPALMPTAGVSGPVVASAGG
jgi:Flp pilus assembly protein TadG